MTILKGVFSLSVNAEPLPNSRGWSSNRFSFSAFTQDRSCLVRAEILPPSSVPRVFGPIIGWFGWVRKFIIPVQIGQQTNMVAFDVVSFTKRLGIDLTQIEDTSSLEVALRKKAAAKAFPQLSEEEIRAIERGQLPGNGSPIKEIEDEGVNRWITIKECGAKDGIPRLFEWRWNYTVGRLHRNQFVKGADRLTLQKNLPCRRGLSADDVALIEETVKKRYMESWQRVCNTKASVSEQLQLPGGFFATLTFDRIGEVRVNWEAFFFDETGKGHIFQYSWELFQNRFDKNEHPEISSYQDKKSKYLTERPLQFRRLLLERSGDINMPKEDANRLADAILARPNEPFEFSVAGERYQVTHLADGRLVLDLGERTRAFFDSPGVLPKILRCNTQWDLLSGSFYPNNQPFFARNKAFISNNLTCAGMDLSLADKINDYVIEHYESLMYQVFSSRVTRTVPRGVSQVPYGLEFDIEGRGWAKKKDYRERPAGATKIGKQAYGLFREGELVMRLVSHPKLGEISRLEREFALLKQLEGIPGIVRPITLTSAVNKRGEPTLSLYEERCNLGSLSDHFKYLVAEQRNRIFESLIETLASLHAQGVVHRDLKEANIYLSSLKWAPLSRTLLIDPSIGDFDLALKVVLGSKPCPLGGTKPYLSPEKARAWLGQSTWTEQDEFASDVWALGVVFAQVAGVPGKAGALSIEELARLETKHQGEIVSNITSSNNLDGLVNEMLQIDSKKRLTAKEALSKWQKISKRGTTLFSRLGPIFRGREPEPWPPQEEVKEEACAAGPRLRAVKDKPDHFSPKAP